MAVMICINCMTLFDWDDINVPSRDVSCPNCGDVWPTIREVKNFEEFVKELGYTY